MQIRDVQVHRTLGRLRVRSADLKSNYRNLQHIQGCLAQIDGVHSVQVSLLTGSLLIHFDSHRSNHEFLLQAIMLPIPSQKSVSATSTLVKPVQNSSGSIQKATKIIFVYAAEKLIEHLTLSLVAAVL